jgi:hypothetical protein
MSNSEVIKPFELLLMPTLISGLPITASALFARIVA